MVYIYTYLDFVRDIISYTSNLSHRGGDDMHREGRGNHQEEALSQHLNASKEAAKRIRMPTCNGSKLSSPGFVIRGEEGFKLETPTPCQIHLISIPISAKLNKFSSFPF